MAEPGSTASRLLRATIRARWLRCRRLTEQPVRLRAGALPAHPTGGARDAAKRWIQAQLTPFLCVADGHAAIEWYREVLGAEVTYDPITMPDGRLGHVEMAVDGAGWMMSGEFPDHHVQGPDPTRGAAVTLHLAVDDVDGLARRMAEAGATLDRGPADDDQAGRVAVLRDPFGHRWFLNGPLTKG